jgi:hypothetical protein
MLDALRTNTTAAAMTAATIPAPISGPRTPEGHHL